MDQIAQPGREGASAQPDPPTRATAPVLAPGQSVGSYQVRRLLGRGGMGTVYEAVHTQIESRVAIKVLHADSSAEPEIMTRFIDEARAVNIVRHPSIVDIYELGHLPDGAAYIVMEYLEGQSLGARLTWCGGRLGPVILLFARQIASALAAAHQKGIVHRDLKPDNVMIVPDPEMPTGERVKIVDFGIAKLAHELRRPLDTPTHVAVIMGTPAYMSPEQCCGAAAVDGQTDVYALGAILYQLLTGAPPFVAAEVSELLRFHISVPPQPLRSIDPLIPVELADLVHAMLAKPAAARPSMAEVAARLERMHTTAAMQPLPIARALRLRKLALALAGVAVAAITAALVVGLFALL